MNTHSYGVERKDPLNNILQARGLSFQTFPYSTATHTPRTCTRTLSSQMTPEQPLFHHLFRMYFPQKSLFPDFIVLHRTGIHIGKTPVNEHFHEIFVRSCTREEETNREQRFVAMVDANQWQKGTDPISNTFLRSPTWVCTPTKLLPQKMSLRTSAKLNTRTRSKLVSTLMIKIQRAIVRASQLTRTTWCNFSTTLNWANMNLPKIGADLSEQMSSATRAARMSISCVWDRSERDCRYLVSIAKLRGLSIPGVWSWSEQDCRYLVFEADLSTNVDIWSVRWRTSVFDTSRGIFGDFSVERALPHLFWLIKCNVGRVCVNSESSDFYPPGSSKVRLLPVVLVIIISEIRS